VKAVIAESFERIHRSNLVGIGVLPLQFTGGDNRKSLGLDGSERFDVAGLAGTIQPGATLACTITCANGQQQRIALKLRLDTRREVDYYRNGGILLTAVRERLQ
ncbi:MAG: acnA, partial [Ramlibacter sp.]|nr:acnA [Ramlibacter sp.]